MTLELRANRTAAIGAFEVEEEEHRRWRPTPRTSPESCISCDRVWENAFCPGYKAPVLKSAQAFAQTRQRYSSPPFPLFKLELFCIYTMSSQTAVEQAPATKLEQQEPAQLSDKAQEARIAYRGPPLPSVPEDVVVPGVLDLDCDERLWVPQSPDVWFRPLLFSVSQGYFVNILRVRKSGILSRHRHAGPVHATVLKGRWHYLEHPWWATEGGYAYEPPGDIHTLEVPEDVKEMVTLFHVTGAYIYVDPDGNPEGIEDVYSKLNKARKHYEAVGLGASFADQFVR